MADGRLAVVIASQCRALIDQGANYALGFVPPVGWTPGSPLSQPQRLAVELHAELTDPAAGACDPVPDLATIDDITLAEQGGGLVINPTLTVAKRVLSHSFTTARDANAGLVAYFLGHGFHIEPERTNLYHFLQVLDSAAEPVTDEDAWNPYRQIEQLLPNSRLSAFMLLVDACWASSAEPSVAQWRNVTGGSPHLWVGSSQQTQAFDGCFTRATVDLLRSGLPESAHPTRDLKQRFDVGDLRRAVDDTCRARLDADTGKRKRQHTTAVANPAGEPALYIAVNRAAGDLNRRLGLKRGTADRLLAAREHYQPNHPEDVKHEFDGHDFAVITGGAGSGKTVLAAVLRHPPEQLHLNRVNAVAFLERLTTPHLLADALHPQLATIPAYQDAIDLHRRADQQAFDRQSAFERYLDGPLTYFDGRVTIVADGLDQLDVDSARDQTIDALTRLPAAHPGKIRILATSRPEGPIPAGAHRIPIPALTEPVARSYLATRGVADHDLQDRVLHLGDTPNWLVLKLAADQALADPDRLTADVGEMYRTIVTDAKADPDLDARDVDRVVAVLAAAGQVAGVGPRLPYPLFEHAVEHLGGASTRAALYPILSQKSLYRIVERSHPATADEHVGLFHLTTIVTLSHSSTIPMPDAHTAIVAAIDVLDPPNDQT